MSNLNTFLADFIRGITASAPQVDEEGCIERHSVQSQDPLGFFQRAEAAREGVRRLEVVHE